MPSESRCHLALRNLGPVKWFWRSSCLLTSGEGEGNGSGVNDMGKVVNGTNAAETMSVARHVAWSISPGAVSAK